MNGPIQTRRCEEEEERCLFPCPPSSFPLCSNHRILSIWRGRIFRGRVKLKGDAAAAGRSRRLASFEEEGRYRKSQWAMDGPFALSKARSFGEQEVVVSNCLPMRRTTERARHLRAAHPSAHPPGQNGPYKPFIVIDRQIDDNKGPAAGSGGSPPTPRSTTAADCRPLTERREGTEGLTRQ